MENTRKVLFSSRENQPVWFVAMDAQKWIGPLSATEVVEKIESGELTWAHYGWRKEQGKWVRLCDIPAFGVAVPEEPPAPVRLSQATSKKAAPPAPPSQAEKQWFLYYSDSQFGPFPEHEIHRFLHIGKIHGGVHAWCEGMQGWEKLQGIEEFAESIEEGARARKSAKPAKPAKAEKIERRKAPRAPLVARSIMAVGGQVFTGMCRDVSVGGMQVLTPEMEVEIGTRLKLNISTPKGADGGIKAFVAEGVVVRRLEDGNGFSFRFDKLPAEGKKAIESYVKKQS